MEMLISLMALLMPIQEQPTEILNTPYGEEVIQLKEETREIRRQNPILDKFKFIELQRI